MTRFTLVKSARAQAIITPLQSFYMQPGWQPITRRHSPLASPALRFSEASSNWILPKSFYRAFHGNNTTRSRAEVSDFVNAPDILNMQIS